MTDARITLSLPMPPSINSTHGVTSGRKARYARDEDGERVFAGFAERQRIYRKPHYRRWINEAGAEIIAARPGLAVRELPAGWYCARMLWPASAPVDADNPCKPLSDLLHFMRVTPDDRWLWRVSATRSRRIEPGRCEVTVWSVEP